MNVGAIRSNRVSRFTRCQNGLATAEAQYARDGRDHSRRLVEHWRNELDKAKEQGR